jgi:hypothetical protein
VCTGHVQLKNFVDDDFAGAMTVDVSAMSPSTDGATAAFQIHLYASETTLSRVIEKEITKTVTVESPIYPYDYWFEWPTRDLVNRVLRAGSTGEIFIRLELRLDVPLGGKIEIEFP